MEDKSNPDQPAQKPEPTNQYEPWIELGQTEVEYWKQRYIEARSKPEPQTENVAGYNPITQPFSYMQSRIADLERQLLALTDQSRFKVNEQICFDVADKAETKWRRETRRDDLSLARTVGLACAKSQHEGTLAAIHFQKYEADELHAKVRELQSALDNLAHAVSCYLGDKTCYLYEAAKELVEKIFSKEGNT